MADSPSSPSVVDFHFDVMCPFAYQTSKWIRDVRAQTGLQINWKFFSLEEINRRPGKKHPWEREWSYGWSMMRIGALLRRSSMDDLDRWYRAAGCALHEKGLKPHEPDVARHLLSELGLDPGLVDAAIADQSTHDVVKAEHDRVVESGGYGVPTLYFHNVHGYEHLHSPADLPGTLDGELHEELARLVYRTAVVVAAGDYVRESQGGNS